MNLVTLGLRKNKFAEHTIQSRRYFGYCWLAELEWAMLLIQQPPALAVTPAHRGDMDHVDKFLFKCINLQEGKACC